MISSNNYKSMNNFFTNFSATYKHTLSNLSDESEDLNIIYVGVLFVNHFIHKQENDLFTKQQKELT